MAFQPQPCAQRLCLPRRATGKLGGGVATSCPASAVRRAREDGLVPGGLRGQLQRRTSGVVHGTGGVPTAVARMAGGAHFGAWTGWSRAQAGKELVWGSWSMTKGDSGAASREGVFAGRSATAARAFRRSVASGAHSTSMSGEPEEGGTLKISTFNIWCPLFRRMEGGEARECDYREL